MEITFRGNASFLLKGQRTVAINPNRGDEADIALHSARLVKGKHYVNGPGEYEIGGVLIVTVCPDRASGALVHAITIDDINVLHVNGSSLRLSERDLLDIGRIDVLIIGSDNLQSAESAFTEISPRVVLPHGDQAAELCALLGVKDAQPQTRFTWNGTGATPRAVLLKPHTSKQRAA